MVFVGYHATRAYKFFDPIKEKVLLSRDVQVLEHESWDWKHMQTNLNWRIVDSSILMNSRWV